jgi:Fasciclin domain
MKPLLPCRKLNCNASSSLRIGRCCNGCCLVSGSVTSDQIQTGVLRTLGGGIAVRVTPERIVLNNGSVTQADIPAQNGVVHGINQVLMPQELRQEILAL